MKSKLDQRTSYPILSPVIVLVVLLFSRSSYSLQALRKTSRLAASHRAAMSSSPSSSASTPPPTPIFGGFNHCGLLVSDIQQSLRFYCEVLGFEDESHLRPHTLEYAGAFLRVGNQQQIHLMQLLPTTPDHDQDRIASSLYGGKDRHVAIAVQDFEVLIARLQHFHVPHSLSSSGRKALFCRDRDDNAIEFVQV